jgi:hypothetical protein
MKKNIIKGSKEIIQNLKVDDRVLVFRPRVSNKLREQWYSGIKLLIY